MLDLAYAKYTSFRFNRSGNKEQPYLVAKCACLQAEFNRVSLHMETCDCMLRCLCCFPVATHHSRYLARRCDEDHRSVSTFQKSIGRCHCHGTAPKPTWQMRVVRIAGGFLISKVFSCRPFGQREQRQHKGPRTIVWNGS
jgi:hypothetical protein